jgi:hypothetical protein
MAGLIPILMWPSRALTGVHRRWENDTLVVDTKYFVAEHHWVDSGIPGSDALHIVERIKLTNEGKNARDRVHAHRSQELGRRLEDDQAMQRVDERDIAEVECLPDLNEHMPTTHSNANVR